MNKVGTAPRATPNAWVFFLRLGDTSVTVAYVILREARGWLRGVQVYTRHGHEQCA
jgi:hypothetical protein